jgi:hypothetical protein
MKIALVRTLTYCIHGKSFTPHPTNMAFDNTDDPVIPPALSGNAIDEIIKAIPPYLQQAAKLVIGMGPEDLDEDVIDAVSIAIEREQKKYAKRDDGYTDLILFEEDDDDDS